MGRASLIWDRDWIYGAAVARLRAMGIRDKPVAPGRMALSKQLIGSIRRECVDHIIVLSEAVCAGF